MIRHILFSTVVFILFFSCSNDSSEKEIISEISTAKEIAEEDGGTNQIDKHQFSITGMLESIPPPVELSALLKSTGAAFQKEILHNPNQVDQYNSNFKKALNLGIYGADLGYINIYGKTFATFDHLTAVYELSSALKINQYFDFETIKRLATNKRNLDSIIYITTIGFEKMNTQLRIKNQEQISFLILFGGWLESLHLAIDVASNSNDKATINRIRTMLYDESIILEDIIELIKQFEYDEDYKKLLVELQTLQKVYANMTVEEIEDNGEWLIIMNNNDFDQLKTSVAKLRKVIIA